MTTHVTAQKQNELYQKMQQAGIKEEDITETFIRSSGPGGQNVNKVASCVSLLHRPTGIQVKCQIARTQGLNRFYARKLLFEEFQRRAAAKQQKEKQLQEKIRRQKRKRSRQAKEKMLENKRYQAQKKQSRQKHPLSKLHKYY